MGTAKVFISDIVDHRLDFAKSLGMIPVNPLRENLEEVVKSQTDGEGCDVFFECSGSKNSAMDMTEVTRVSGMICMVAVHKEPHEVNLKNLNFKEQHLIGTRVYTKEEFKAACELAEHLEKELEQVVSHIVPLEESTKVFDMISNPEDKTVKVVVDCQSVRNGR